MPIISQPVFHIIVIGFHHKKGCQVEHCYPEIIPGRPTELPSQWKHLPALALPDGSHNYLSDTIFFHLPGLSEPPQTVYAISCFRQIPLEQVVQKTEDMTRSSVQKSVCVICRAPVFGRLAIKMELVVKEWFLQGDFSQTQLLEEAYRNLNNCPIQSNQMFEGMSVSRLVDAWRHKLLLLLKLLLLRRRVLVFGNAAGPLSAAVLALVSLLPRCIDQGLHNAANFTLSRPLSPMSNAQNEDTIENAEAAVEIPTSLDAADGEILSPKETGNLIDEKDVVNRQSFDESLLLDEKDITTRDKCNSVSEKNKNRISECQSPTLPRDMSVDGLNNLTSQLDYGECGFPLPLFEDGYLCLPYLSLQYLELVADPAAAGFVVGASNVLFKQKRQLFDVVVELGELRVETADPALRRQLALGTEDLRFADHVVRYGLAQGDAWIRDQFASYLIYLLRTSLLPEGSREVEPYNSQFMSAFKSTATYARWADEPRGDAFLALAPAHPFAGQLSMADMKLKLAHTMSTTEGGRKVTAAVASTGRAVASTGRAVGGALSHARGALTGWWSALTAPPNAQEGQDYTSEPPHSDAEDAADQLECDKDDNRGALTPEPPDKTMHDNTNTPGKITVV